jgi:hypothetical protein
VVGAGAALLGEAAGLPPTVALSGEAGGTSAAALLGEAWWSLRPSRAKQLRRQPPPSRAKRTREFRESREGAAASGGLAHAPTGIGFVLASALCTTCVDLQRGKPRPMPCLPSALGAHELCLLADCYLENVVDQEIGKPAQAICSPRG